MTSKMRIIGAGLGRTGTMSLKIALERLLGGPCYHMLEVFSHPDHVATWHDAVRGEPIDWHRLFDGYTATVDFPACSFWREISDAYDGAIVVLSSRDDGETWFRSANETGFEVLRRSPAPGTEAWHAMANELLRTRFTEHYTDRREAITAYERWNADVRSSVDPSRFVDWRPSDGWRPICDALSLPVPSEPFPYVNTTDEFRARAGWTQAGDRT